MSLKELRKKCNESIAAQRMLVVEAAQSIQFHLIGKQVALWVEPVADYIDALEKELSKKPKSDLEEELNKVREENERLQEDVAAMRSSVCTSFERCKKCGKLHDKTYVCSCGHDNSTGEGG